MKNNSPTHLVPLFQVQFIVGSRFTEIFVEQYDKIMEAMYNDDMDELAGKLKFKKSLVPL